MARIGNEARLILKLANERAEQKACDIYKLKFANAASPDAGYTNGWRDSKNFYTEELYRIIEELERS